MDMRDKSLGGCALGCALALLSWVIILGAGYALWRLVSQLAASMWCYTSNNLGRLK